MTRDQIISEVRRRAEANGGQPLGERMFYRDTGWNKRILTRAGFPNYGHAREAAGYARGTLQRAYSDDELFAPLAQLTREKQRFPTVGELQVAQYSTGTPSYEAYRRASKRGPLRTQLLEWCRRHLDFADVSDVVESTPDVPSTARSAGRQAEKVVSGYVYLMRYGGSGRDYKIGRTDNVSRRESQIDMMSPTDVRRVHVIATDDPRGIERYWQDRFANRRVGTKEIFRLTSEDVAAFRRRRYQ
jgi:hypothetical protein